MEMSKVSDVNEGMKTNSESGWIRIIDYREFIICSFNNPL